jgi:hypothetical protein
LVGLSLFISANPQNFITPTVLTTLPEALNETSGLLNLNGEIWTHIDNGGKDELYRIDKENGNILRTVKVHNANNVDWEDIASDENYVYIGDFGNNDGSRTNLRVYKISREQLLSSNDVDAEKIEFIYSDQFSFEPNFHNTNFDCEALSCLNNKLYLFTKNWIDKQTSVYELTTETGNSVAQKISTFNIGCLVTGAEIIPYLNTLLLIGYNESGGTYTWVFTNFSGNDFFGADQTKLIWTSLTQAEGICYAGDLAAYAATEKYAGELDPTLYFLDLSEYMIREEQKDHPEIILKLVDGKLIIETFKGNIFTGVIKVFSVGGMELRDLFFTHNNRIEMSFNFPAGIYIIQCITGDFVFSEKIVLTR